MNDRLAMEAIRDLLRENLEDPLEQWGNAPREWIHTDSPLTRATYPRIEIVKRPSSAAGIIDIGPEFLEWYSVILDIYFWYKVEFKWKQDDVYLKNEQFGEEYTSKIWTEGIKPYVQHMHDTYAITGLKNMETVPPEKTEDMQFYKSSISVRLWYFRT